jgi:hypothetical protein
MLIKRPRLAETLRPVRLSREDRETLLPLAKEDLVSRLSQSYHTIQYLYHEQDMLLFLLNLLASQLHLWSGLALNPAPCMGQHYILVVDLPGGQVYWPIQDDHLSFYRDTPIYHWPVSPLTVEERTERLRLAATRLMTESQQTEPMEILHDRSSSPSYPD